MLPNARKKQILTWLKKEKALKISDISKRLNVSEMTIYRDVKPLIEMNHALKIPNGIGLPNPPSRREGDCHSCLKPVHARLSFEISFDKQQLETFCCARCGLMRYHDTKEDVTQVTCKDYLTDTRIDATGATYLLHSDLNLNCCQPQIITFASRIHARQFQTGFGGDVYHYEEAIRILTFEIDGNACQRN
ncbi:HTH domain-containing protein [Guptibacillus hwajinpoensis]|uniref:HTH deoR-type domain-containing protein n=1 Tax=Guptibacillus hwajinpoensis TaxID=208199 RepID=A0ABU0K5M5_9BACL|nr:HTH domain-containing protein [Alkalihalobacillus hemicentroti]MDQ0483668.1 hypothetical protein [Alkalihalobacillus hemicentroti]